MTLRTINYELEAMLTGKRNGLFSRPSGKVERKSYRGGVERLKIKLRNIKTHDHAVAVAKADGKVIAQLSISGGKARYDNESSDPGAIPVLEKGQMIEIEINGESILSGRLYRD
jgi:hypothetical protein